jgi:hypothetical protein
MNNGREESHTVLYWMDGPHSPEYPDESKLLAAFRENQQLRKQLEASRHAGEVLMHTSNANFDRFKAAEQQLAQIRDAIVPDFDWVKMEAIAQDELCPECEGQEYCAACLAIKGTRWALKMKETIAALRLDNTQKEHDVAEWSTVANLGNDRIATAKAVGVVFTDPGTTCVNQRAEDAEAKVPVEQGEQREDILPNVTAVRLLYPNDGKEIYNIESHETIRGRVFYRLTGLKGALFVRESLAPTGSHLSNAPSEPIDLSEDDIEAATQWCSEIAGESLRKEYIKIDAANRALVRTIAQLRQQVKDVDKSAKSLYLALYQCGVVIEFVPGSPKIRNQRAEKAEQQVIAAQALASEEEASKNVVIIKLEAAEQQLAQIKEYKGERPHSYIASHYADSHLVCSATEVNKLLNAQDATIAALRLDNAQKDKRIAEVTENCRLAYNKVAGLEQRIAELEGGKS